ncbi:phosphatase PAP2 family protein [Methylocystis sp. IM3]|uniref:phosphatase PAP2 family protein n=1 Tax=unclassified Methylocystis TaxID=2625913 RepID=UPI000FB7FADE|nr:MAG: phosphatase PAP2 family protein [Hyphomicrobiales bacterium]
MAFTTDLAAKLTRDASSFPQDGLHGRWLRRFLDADLAAVHLFSRSARPKLIRPLAIGVSKLGNGWIYPILLVIVFYGLGTQGWRVVALAGANAALLHILYPVIKRRFCRKRPFHVDARLPSLLKTLDEHSFPSGHAMTITGVLAPIVLAWPAMTLSAALLVLSMAWSRIATAHHYPSDVVAGVALGAALAFPLSRCALGYF